MLSGWFLSKIKIIRMIEEEEEEEGEDSFFVSSAILLSCLNDATFAFACILNNNNNPHAEAPLPIFHPPIHSTYSIP